MLRHVRCACWVAVCLVATVCEATTIDVPADQPTIQLAVSACVIVMGTVTAVFGLTPPKKFIYGIWGNAFDPADSVPPGAFDAFVSASPDPGPFTLSINRLQDTLGFNMAVNEVWNSATAESLINRGFKVVEFDSCLQPGHPGDFAMGFHLLWQSDTASIPSWYQKNWESHGGRWVMDNVGGRSDTVWVIGNQPADTPCWAVGTGGCHYKFKSAIPFGVAHRSARFTLKAVGVNPTDPVAVIAVPRWWYHASPQCGGSTCDTMAVDTLYGRDFSGNYQTFTVSWDDTIPPCVAWATVWTRYSLYWFGHGVLYFDEVLSTDDMGDDVVAGTYDPAIVEHANHFTYGTDGSYLLAWFLMEEFTTPENAVCWDTVNMNLRRGAGHKGGFHEWCDTLDAWSATKMVKPDHLMCIDYLAGASRCVDSVVDDSGAVSYSTDSPGGDSVSLQVAFNSATPRFRTYKRLADSAGLVFWPMISSARQFKRCDGNCYEWSRRLTGHELLAHANLALAYGADALSYWHWGGSQCYIDGIYPGSPEL